MLFPVQVLLIVSWKVNIQISQSEPNEDINSRILCRYNYDALGNTINVEEIITNRYGFTGEMHDGITGMYYLRARYYTSDTGRHIPWDGLNLYVYGGNNPVKYVDPSGHYKNNGVMGVGTSSSGSAKSKLMSSIHNDSRLVKAAEEMGKMSVYSKKLIILLMNC